MWCLPCGEGGLELGKLRREKRRKNSLMYVCMYVCMCSMYEERFPEVDDVVMVQVKSIAEMGAYVTLLEYNNIEGMILLSELSRRRIRSISKLIKVGRQEPVMVLRVDKEKVRTHSRTYTIYEHIFLAYVRQCRIRLVALYLYALLRGSVVHTIG